jgi:endonuclease/exonuclease/phosphatase family metal-dependent hydrolase
MDLLMEGLGLEFRVVNIYEPHEHRPAFWDRLLKRSLLKSDTLIVGGDLNFSSGEAESWGPHALSDPNSEFFSHLLIQSDLIDIAPIKLLPTWRNTRSRESRVAKRLDRFFISKKLLEGPLQFRHCVGSGGESNHSPIWLEVAVPQNLPALLNST